MAAEFHRLRERKAALSALHDIRRNAKSTFVIHYSCESFYETHEGSTARVTSIAVRNLATGQTYSFSIHKIAEQEGHRPATIPQQYDDLERKMLGEFYEFVRNHSGFTFVHWNMRDANYGFPALEHRYKVLKGTPFVIADDKRFDLARAMVAIYGRGYIDHGNEGRFLNIARYNNITDRDALNGAQEAAAFTEQEYVKLHQSTLRKVDMMANLFERAEDRSLQTKARWRDIYGMHPQLVMTFVSEHWLWLSFAMIAAIVGFVALFVHS